MNRIIFAFCSFSLLIVGCAKNDAPTAKNDAPATEICDPHSFIINKPGWNDIRTKAYSRSDLTTPTMNIGEKVSVIDQEGGKYIFTISADKDSSAVLTNSSVELIAGHKYRVLYPEPEVRETDSCFPLGFGDYDCTPSLDWLYSDFTEFPAEGKFIIDLKRLNSAIIVDFESPIEGKLYDARLQTDSLVFLIKGAFYAMEEAITPERTTWQNAFLFPLESEIILQKGEKYSLLITLYPWDYSTESYTFEVYAGDQGATAEISIPKLNEGDVLSLNPTNFTVLEAPCSPRRVFQGEKFGLTWTWQDR